ncbi:cytochrome P450 [Peniophora sp. CONT]|nr:cytochrome P450 [Peniophora sp. CONT]
MSHFCTVLLLVSSLPLAGILLLARKLVQQRLLRKIPGPPSASILRGNFLQFFNPSAIPYQEKLRNTYGRTFKLNGYLGDQIIVTSDVKALHHVVVKHVDIFDSARWFLELARLLFGKGLLAAPMAGDAHKHQRRLMNPAFSTAHMKRMIPIFHACSKQLRDIVVTDLKRTGRKEIDILDAMGRCALELIAQAGFGYSFGALDGSDSEFSYAVKRIVPNGARLMKYRPFIPFLTRTFPPWLLRKVGKRLPNDALQQQFNVVDTLTVAAGGIWEEKKRLHASGEKASNSAFSEGRDLLSILLNENNKASEEDRLPDDELLGQIGTFLFAGTDTTSNSVSRILYMLALNPDIQDKLRKEFVEAGAPDNLDYDDLDRLPYLDAVCRETLRMYAPVRFMQRVARQDHFLPLQNPIVDASGKITSEIFVPEGTAVYCNIAAVNTDPAIWGSDANEWKPERWLSPLPPSVANAHVPGVYANMLTFSGGSRSCIGFKFSQLEMKVILSQFLPTFRFEPSKKHDIVWRFGGIVTPATKSGFATSKPELPLRTTLL